MIKFKYFKTLATYNSNSSSIATDDVVFIEGDNSLRTHGKTYKFYTGTDAAAGITSSDISNWNSKTSNTGTVTGTGTNGYLTKWTGGSSIGNLIALSSSISSQTQSTKFLREDGTWAAPSYTSNDGNTQYYLTLNGTVNGTSGKTNLGTVYAPTTAGTSGYYLKSSGSGAPTWASFPTIPAALVQSDWNATSGMGVILNKPTIPTNTNQLTNGAGFITSVPSSYKKSYASVVSVSANQANVTCPSTLSADGEECTVLYVNSGTSSDYSVTVSTTYTTPDGAQLDLTCPKGGYCEVNYMKIGSTTYARGL